jgi:hypothetical protein
LIENDCLPEMIASSLQRKLPQIDNNNNNIDDDDDNNNDNEIDLFLWPLTQRLVELISIVASLVDARHAIDNDNDSENVNDVNVDEKNNQQSVLLKRSSSLLCCILTSLRRRLTYFASGVAGIESNNNNDDNISDNNVDNNAKIEDFQQKEHLQRAAMLLIGVTALCAAGAGLKKI